MTSRDLALFLGAVSPSDGSEHGELVVVCSGNWIGYVLVAPILGWAFLRAFVLPARATPPFAFRWYARWWAMIVINEFVLWLGLFYKADRIGEWIGSGEMRAGDKIRRYAWRWRPAKIGSTSALRLLRSASASSWRRFASSAQWLIALIVELYALSVLFGALVQYVVFKRGADVHIFGRTTSRPTLLSRWGS